MKLTSRLFIHIMVSLAVVVLPVSLYQMYSLLKTSYEESYNDNLRVLRSFSSPVADALWGLDNNYMKQLATSIVLSEAITRVEIYDEDLKIFIGASKVAPEHTLAEDKNQKIMALADLKGIRSGEIQVFHDETTAPFPRLAIPIQSVQGLETQPSFHGVLAVEYSLQGVNAEIIYRILQNAALIAMFSVVVTTILFFSLKKSVVNPLFDLLQAMKDMPSDRTVRLNPQANHTYEFVRIFDTFNNMVEDLEEKENVITEQRKQIVQSSKMSALGEMAAGIAHEINNPLAIIVGYNHIVRELIKRDPLNKTEIVRNLGKIQETTDRISKIIQGLRSFSRNSAGDARKWTPLALIVENTLEFCSQRFKNYGIDLILDPVPVVEIFCRDSQIIQVLLNLLNNAFDAVQEQPDQSWIRFGFSLSEERLLIQITDSGLGIPPEVAEKIMQPFFTTKEVGKGTGLGLSISKGIVEEHGGQLRFVQDSPHTQFVVEFPSHLFRPIRTGAQATALT
jgi:signal transduction histidine kinase